MNGQFLYQISNGCRNGCVCSLYILCVHVHFNVYVCVFIEHLWTGSEGETKNGKQRKTKLQRQRTQERVCYTVNILTFYFTQETQKGGGKRGTAKREPEKRQRGDKDSKCVRDTEGETPPLYNVFRLKYSEKWINGHESRNLPIKCCVRLGPSL